MNKYILKYKKIFLEGLVIGLFVGICVGIAAFIHNNR